MVPINLWFVQQNLKLLSTCCSSYVAPKQHNLCRWRPHSLGAWLPKVGMSGLSTLSLTSASWLAVRPVDPWTWNWRFMLICWKSIACWEKKKSFLHLKIDQDFPRALIQVKSLISKTKSRHKSSLIMSSWKSANVWLESKSSPSQATIVENNYLSNGLSRSVLCGWKTQIRFWAGLLVFFNRHSQHPFTPPHLILFEKDNMVKSIMCPV